ncbi:MAG: PEP-CTERM sorting domain-containing protein, partial [Phycisphaeraceae bacterium]
VVDYPNGGGHNVAADSAGLRPYLGVDVGSLTPGFNVVNIDNSRFAFRGYILVTTAMDLTPGGVINTMLRLDSDDDGNIVINGGLDANGTTGAIGLNLARNVTHAIEFPSAGVYQFDLLYQEGGGNTGVTLRAQFADLAGGALTVVPGSYLAPNLTDTPATAPFAITAIPGAPISHAVGDQNGLAGQFFNSSGSVTSIRTLLNNNATPDRTFSVSVVDYPNGGGHNTASDANGLISLLGTDGPSLSPFVDIANVDNSRFAFRGFFEVDAAMDMDNTLAGVQVMLRLSADDDANMVFNGGSDADGTTGIVGLNLARNVDHFLTFSAPGVYQFDILWQETGGSTGITLLGQLANVNNGVQAVVPGEFLFQSITIVPEPATVTLGLMGLAGLMMRRRRAA